MKFNILLLFICIILIGAATLYMNRPAPPTPQKVPVQTTEDIKDYPAAPEFETQLIDGNVLSLQNISNGKTVILNFWASWCAPCIKEFPFLLELAEKESDNLVLLAVSVDAEKDNIFKFLDSLDDISENNLRRDNVFIAWDPEKKISQDLFQTLKYPETYIIAPDLTLRQKIIGADTDFTSEKFINSLKKITNF